MIKRWCTYTRSVRGTRYGLTLVREELEGSEPRTVFEVTVRCVGKGLESVSRQCGHVLVVDEELHGFSHLGDEGLAGYYLSGGRWVIGR